MLGRSALAGNRPDARQEARGPGSSQEPGEPHRTFTNTPGGQAGHGVNVVARGSSSGYLGYMLCNAGRQDLLTTRHVHDRLPPEMPPMC